MKLQIILFSLFLNTIIFGQETNKRKIDKLKKEVVQVENEIQIKKDSLKILKGKIKQLENQEYFSNFKQKDGSLSMIAVLRIDGKLRKSNSIFSEILTTFSKNDTVKLTDYQDGYWVINKGQYFGYMSEMYINETENVKKFKSELQKQNEGLLVKKKAEESNKLKIAHERKIALMIQKKKEYRQEIINKYGKKTGQKLLDGYYWIGMTDDMALISLGHPESINKTVGTWGVHEQWVYKSIYLYFENGKLTSYQNSR